MAKKIDKKLAKIIRRINALGPRKGWGLYPQPDKKEK